MRVMLTASPATEAGNEAMRSGQMAKVIQEFVERVHPEAIYFGLKDGRRTCYAVFEVQDGALLAPITEPLFQELQCTIEVVPVVTAEQLLQSMRP